jgi:hypothetical protein
MIVKFIHGAVPCVLKNLPVINIKTGNTSRSAIMIAKRCMTAPCRTALSPQDGPSKNSRTASRMPIPPGDPGVTVPMNEAMIKADITIKIPVISLSYKRIVIKKNKPKNIKLMEYNKKYLTNGLIIFLRGSNFIFSNNFFFLE